MVNGSGCPHQLNQILGIDGPQKPLTWFGDGEKELKGQCSIFHFRSLIDNFRGKTTRNL